MYSGVALPPTVTDDPSGSPAKVPATGSVPSLLMIVNDCCVAFEGKNPLMALTLRIVLLRETVPVTLSWLYWPVLAPPSSTLYVEPPLSIRLPVSSTPMLLPGARTPLLPVTAPVVPVPPRVPSLSDTLLLIDPLTSKL